MMAELTNRERREILLLPSPVHKVGHRTCNGDFADNEVAVLADGDNTTWSGDAFLVHLTDDEMAELEDDPKSLRGIAETRRTYSAVQMLGCLDEIKEAIHRINRALKVSDIEKIISDWEL